MTVRNPVELDVLKTGGCVEKVTAAQGVLSANIAVGSKGSPPDRQEVASEREKQRGGNPVLKWNAGQPIQAGVEPPTLIVGNSEISGEAQILGRPRIVVGGEAKGLLRTAAARCGDLSR